MPINRQQCNVLIRYYSGIEAGREDSAIACARSAQDAPPLFSQQNASPLSFIPPGNGAHGNTAANCVNIKLFEDGCIVPG